jgi:hypothetical protein
MSFARDDIEDLFINHNAYTESRYRVKVAIFKRVWSVVLLFFLLVGMSVLVLSVQPARSSPATQMVIMPEQNTFYTNTTAPGTTFCINITVIDVADLVSWQLNLTWDSSLLNFSQATLPSDYVFAGQAYMIVIDVEVGSVIFGARLGPGGTGFSGTGVLCQIELEILNIASPPVATCNLTLAAEPVDTFLSDSTLAHISFTTGNATFTYIQTELANLGDLNQDGKIDLYDAIITASAFQTYPGHPKWNSLADLNHDNVIDVFDIIILAANFGKH